MMGSTKKGHSSQLLKQYMEEYLGLAEIIKDQFLEWEQGLELTPKSLERLCSFILSTEGVKAHTGEPLKKFQEYLPQYIMDTQEDTAGKADRLESKDSLTGLMNDTGLDDEISKHIANYVRFQYEISQGGNKEGYFALIFIDLDGFKGVNDAYNHQYGNEVLKEAARLLEGIFRSVDGVARLSGDEFAIVADIDNVEYLQRKMIDGCVQLGEGLQKKLDSDNSGNKIKIGSSWGGAIYGVHTDDTAKLYTFADDASAFNKGENDIHAHVFDPNLQSAYKDARIARINASRVETLD